MFQLSRDAGEADLSLRAGRLIADVVGDAADRVPERIEALELVSTSDEPEESIHALTTAALIAETELGDPLKAFGLLQHAATKAWNEPQLESIVERLHMLASATEQPGQLLELLTEGAERTHDADTKVMLLRRAADVSRTAADHARAKDFLRRLLELQPDDAQALDLFEELCRQTDDQRGVADVLERRIEIADSPDDRTAFLFMLGRLLLDELDDVEGAISVYERVRDEGPPAAAVAELRTLYRRVGRWESLIGLLERALEDELVEPAGAYYELGTVYKDQLDDIWQAIEQFKLALEHGDDTSAALGALEPLLAHDAYRADVAEILEPVYLRRADWTNVTAVLEARLSAESDPDARKGLLQRLAQLHEDYLEDLDGALQSYARVFREDPRDESVWESLLRLARVQERWETVANIFGEVLSDATIDDDVMARLALATAQLYEKFTTQPADALELFRRVQEFDPASEEAFEGLERVLTKTGDWARLDAVYERRLEGSLEDWDRGQALSRRAQLLVQKLDQPETAIEVYRELLDLDPSRRDVSEELGALLQGAQRWHELADITRQRLDFTEDEPTRRRLRHRLATLSADHLDDRSTAVSLWEENVQGEPHGASMESLESMLDCEDVRERAAEVLESVYRAARLWRKLIALFDAKARVATEGREAGQAFAELAKLHEVHSQDHGAALAAWSRAVQCDPTEASFRDELERMARERGSWTVVVEAYESALSNTDDVTLKSELLSAVARIHDRERGDPRAAIVAFERLATLDPDDATPLEALEALHTMVGDWRGMADVLRRRAERAFDVTEKGELWRRVGSTLEELVDDAVGAIAAYRAALTEDETDEVALQALDRLFLRQGDFESLSEILARRFDQAQDEIRRLELALRLATLEESELHRPERAIDAYQRVIEIRPEHRGALEALSKLYASEQRFTDLVDNLQVRIEISSDDVERAELLFQLGSSYQRRLNDPLEAISAYERALDVSAAHEPSLDALIQLASDEEHTQRIVEVLEARLESLGRWDDLVSVLSTWAVQQTDPVDQHMEYQKIARIHEEQRDDLEAAFSALASALRANASEMQTVDELERLAAPIVAWERLVALLEDLAQAHDDEDSQYGLWVREAAIAADRLGDLDKAIAAYRRADGLRPDEELVLGELDQLLTRTERYGELADLLERRQSLAGAPEEQAALLCRLGVLQKEQLGREEEALNSLREALALQPRLEPARASLLAFLRADRFADEVIGVLDDAYRADDDASGLADLLSIRAERAQGRARADLLTELAQLREQVLDDPRGAFTAAQEALLADPTDLSALDELERLAELNGDWNPLAGLAERAALSVELDDLQRRDLLMRAAMWYEEHLNRPDVALECLGRVIESEPRSPDAHLSRVRILRATGDASRLADALAALARSGADPASARDCLEEAAQLAEGPVGAPQQAIKYLQEALVASSDEPDLLDRLIRLQEQQAEWPSVVASLNDRLELEMEPQKRAQLRSRIAHVLGEQMADTEAAAQAWRKVAEEDPLQAAPTAPAYRWLKGFYKANNDGQALRALMERAVEVCDDASLRAELRLELADVLAQGSEPLDDAIAQLRDALLDDPGNAEALRRIESLLERAGRDEELLDLLEQQAGDAAAGSDATRENVLLLRAARLCLERLDDTPRACDFYERLLGANPSNLEALRGLAAARKSLGEPMDYADALQRLGAFAQGPEAVAAGLELARVAVEELEDAPRATRALWQVLEAQPAEIAVAEALDKHLVTIGDQQGMADLLAWKADHAADPGAKASHLKRLAHLYSKDMGDMAAASDVLETVASLDPTDEEVVAQLVDLYVGEERLEDAREMLERFLQTNDVRGKAAAAVHHLLGHVLERMGDVGGALQAYDSAFRGDLTNAAILRDLGRLAFSHGDLEKAEKTFKALLLQKLGDELGMTKADVYCYLGEIAAQRGQHDQASNFLQRALAEQADHGRAGQMLATLSH